MTTRPDAGRLLRPDGSVLIPPQLAAEVLRTLVVGATAQARTDGGVIGPGARRLLHQLYEAAQQDAQQRATFAAESRRSDPDMVEITAQQAADRMGCSPQYVRYLARTGRVRARRAGPSWLIDPDSLDAYRAGGLACTSSTSPR